MPVLFGFTVNSSLLISIKSKAVILFGNFYLSKSKVPSSTLQGLKTAYDGTTSVESLKIPSVWFEIPRSNFPPQHRRASLVFVPFLNIFISTKAPCSKVLPLLFFFFFFPWHLFMNVSNFPQLPLCLPCSLFPGLKPFLVTVPFVCGFFCFPEITQVPYNLDSHGPLDPLDSQLELGSQKPSAVWKHKARLISICSQQGSRSEKMVVDFVAFCTNTTPYTDHLFL